MPSPPRHSDGAIGPVSAASSGSASPYEIGRTGILVIVDASLRARRFASFVAPTPGVRGDRKSTRLNSSHLVISYAVFCLKKKKKNKRMLKSTNAKQPSDVHCTSMLLTHYVRIV